MRDPRTDPYADDELTAAYVAEFGDPRLPPTHPDGPRKMRDVPAPGDPVRHVEPVLGREAFYGAANNTDRDLPAPPPIELVVDPAKWRSMTRGQRRAMIREHRRAGGR